MMTALRFLAALMILLIPANSSYAMKSAIDTTMQEEPKTPKQSLILQLSQKIPGARIEITGPLRLNNRQSAENITSLVLMSEDAGQARFRANDAEGYQVEGIAPFSAWMPALVVKKRVLPGARIGAQGIVKQDVNAAVGLAREMRGLIVSPETNTDSLEARQTLLEGQFLTTSAVQTVPDVKRGDAVRIRMVSGNIVLMTNGTANEAAYIEQPVRVMTQKGKRDLVGKLSRDGTVEVKL